MMMLLILLACPAPVVPDLPDLVVKGALLPGAEAMYIAVDEGLIAEIASTPLEGERILEAQLITPGLIDAHCHPAGLGRAMAELRLQDVTSFAEAQDRIRDAEE